MFDPINSNIINVYFSRSRFFLSLFQTNIFKNPAILTTGIDTTGFI